MLTKQFAWPQMLGLLLAQGAGDLVRRLWEKNSPYIGILSDQTWLAIDAAFAGGMLALAYWVYTTGGQEHNWLTNSGRTHALKKFFFGFVIGFLLQGFLILLLLFFCQSVLNADVATTPIRNYFLALPAVLDAVYISTFEELLFRGLLLAGLCRVTSIMKALGIQAGIFALFHLHQAQSSILLVFSIFISGWILGFLVLKYRTLWIGIGAHTAWNFLALALLGTPLSATLLPPIVQLSSLDGAAQSYALNFQGAAEVVAFSTICAFLIFRNRAVLHLGKFSKLHDS